MLEGILAFFKALASALGLVREEKFRQAGRDEVRAKFTEEQKNQAERNAEIAMDRPSSLDDLSDRLRDHGRNE